MALTLEDISASDTDHNVAKLITLHQVMRRPEYFIFSEQQADLLIDYLIN